jgi:polyribonucleotide nucleotidyltransferase
MDLNKKTYRTVLHGEDLSIEVSALAGQANAAVFGKWGGTTVLATAVMSKLDKGGDFFPLTVDYEERFYAAGKILGSKFVRRENRPTDEAILSARLIDRTIRPLFDHRLRREVQIVVTVLTYDERHDPDVIGLIAVSTALGISDIPWNGPVGGAKYAQPDGEKGKGYRAFFAGPKGHINMIEFEGKEVPKEVALQAFAEGERDIAALVDFQEKIIADIGKPKANVHWELPTRRLSPKYGSLPTEKLKKQSAQRPSNT